MTAVRGQEDVENPDVGSVQRRAVFVRAGSWQVQEALASALSRSLAGAAEVHTALADEELLGVVVVAAEDVCSPQACASLTSRGADVIVLAALPRPGREAEYRGVGARAYLPMMLDLGPLVLAITALF